MFNVGDRIKSDECGEGTVVSEYILHDEFILVQRDDGDGWTGAHFNNMPPGRQDLIGVECLWWAKTARMCLIQSKDDFEIDA